jgi:hypothetical protein
MIVWFSEKKHLLMMRLVLKMNNLGRVPVSEVIGRRKANARLLREGWKADDEEGVAQAVSRPFVKVFWFK